jgi:hypothetical protein
MRLPGWNLPDLARLPAPLMLLALRLLSLTSQAFPAPVRYFLAQ